MSDPIFLLWQKVYLYFLQFMCSPWVLLYVRLIHIAMFYLWALSSILRLSSENFPASVLNVLVLLIATLDVSAFHKVTFSPWACFCLSLSYEQVQDLETFNVSVSGMGPHPVPVPMSVTDFAPGSLYAGFFSLHLYH